MIKITIFITLFLLTAVCLASNSDPLWKHSAYKAFPKNEDDLKLLRSIWRKYGSNIDFWSEPNRLLHPVAFSVSPKVRERVVKNITQSGIKISLITKDLKEMVDAETEHLSKIVEAFGADEVTNFETYHAYEKIEQILESWKTKYPENVKTEVIGTTWEKRSIHAIRITDGKVEKTTIIFFECGIHAREWIAPATCLYFINILLGNKIDSESLLNKYDFYFIPVLNVDGYVHSWTTNRNWRRNRFPGTIGFGACHGVDLNRNFEPEHCNVQGVKNLCFQDYCGIGAFSEIESRALRNFINTLTKNKRIKVYFAIHSFGQLWVYPWGYKDTPTTKHKLYNEMAKNATDAIRKTHKQEYSYGQIYQTIYPCSGTSLDWIEYKNLADFAFTIELRDGDDYGFVLPPEFIKPTAEENWNGIKAVIG
ncbi:Carboxypeptidase A2-like protein [Leptotrombidium deliense]|uniref:Carboxypeptidase A2-like protein n=1 Tax=Leptotrombidium deliense TaxID=299467 RepID=A0A443S102_9ACAR|nr:Carboxypeptidase A2-like protein [Leptotrombidium deliense]